MSSPLERAVKNFISILSESQAKQTSAYDTQAKVVRVEDGVAWVHIPGGVDETPVQLTVNAQKGDNVQVRVSGGKAWLVGNASAPPTDDTKAAQAINYSLLAQKAADSAEADAATANEAAQSAMDDAKTAKEVAKSVEDIAEQAQEDAGIAKVSANKAIKGLSQVEDVVGTLDWITAHSSITQDITPQVGVSYYIKNQDGTFTLVTEVEGKNPHEEGWYVIDEAVQNYIMSHLALVEGRGLYVMKDGSKWKVLIADDGIYIVDENDLVINQMSIIGNTVGYENEMHVNVGSNSIGFFNGQDKLGYVGDNKLFFAVVEAVDSLNVTDKYVWRKTPTGAMGLYLR